VTDDELVAAARAGERDALEQLLQLHHERIYAVCRRVTGNDADAADATQEALIAMIRGLPRFDGRAAFSTWAYRIATNASLDELRRRRRRPVPGVPGVEAVQGEPGLETTVADRLQIGDALAQLSDEFRVAVVLRDVADLDYADIAAVLDVPLGTVRSRIARGRAALAQRLGGNRPIAPGRPSAES
jgi:RNA polymerase sigma-70 factor (ECF subfamily)